MTVRNTKNKIFSIIVAIAENNAIGKDNQLLWHISNDLKRFKQLTFGHPVIMGRNTWHSLPVKPLPGRTNIVITDQQEEQFEGAVAVHSIEEAMDSAPSGEECFVMGGGMVYRQFLPVADRLYITRVHQSFDADTFFPEVDETHWTLTSREEVTDDNSVPFRYAYLVYERIHT